MPTLFIRTKTLEHIARQVVLDLASTRQYIKVLFAARLAEGSSSAVFERADCGSDSGTGACRNCRDEMVK